ncbi:MAG: single-stranded DNA-binding protein [Melioribacteraceae bacterium]|nr:single-stranded DNA-binding protein [Melioribacteraceae bacterium]
MAFSLNKVMLIGNLGQDAEHRFTTNNVSVTSFSIATTNSYKGKDGNWVNETTWHNVVAYGLSDFYKDALKKGRKVYVEGRISKRDYTDKDGIKRYVTEVIAERFNGIIPLDQRDGIDNGSQNGDFVSNKDNIETNPDDDLPF